MTNLFTVRRLYPFGQYSYCLVLHKWYGICSDSFNHNANGAMTFDSMIGEEGATLRWNAAGLLHTITDEESGEGATYVWLSDGTKVKMDGDVDSPRYYRGSFVYKDVSISVPTGCLQAR